VCCSEAAGEQLGVQCLAHGHPDMQLMGLAEIIPTTLRLQDDHPPHWATAAPKRVMGEYYNFTENQCANANNRYVIVHEGDSLVFNRRMG